MRIVVTIATIDPMHGGPARTVPALCRALANTGADVGMITIAECGGEIIGSPNDPWIMTVIPTQADRYHPRSWAKQFKEALRKALIAKDAVLYDVGLWLPSNHFASQVASQTRTPLITSPRGMLSHEALKFSKWKKRLAWNLYQRRDLNRARVLHATSEAEARDFRDRSLTQPIAVVPNGVEMPEGIQRSQVSGHRSAMNEQRSRTVLFLSRLHPMKGLPDLVRAWAQVRPRDWRVLVAGPDENNHKAEVEKLAESLGVRGDFEFVGSVDDRQKWKLLSEADLFVLPSYSESFGMAIAEALAAGVPVITTRATPWRDIETHRCGWWVDTGIDSIARALSSATACTREELGAMGARGRELVSKNYSWEFVAENLLSAFEWVLGSAEKPACVV